MTHQRETIRLVVEVAPLVKTSAAYQIDQFARVSRQQLPTEDPDDLFELMSVRRDRAVRRSRGSLQTYGSVALGFNAGNFHELSEYHEAQARLIPSCLTTVHNDWEVTEVRPMAVNPDEFVTDSLRWRMLPDEERLLPDHTLPSDNDTPGELAVCSYSYDRTLYERAGHVGRLLMFNGLGGNHRILPPAVAGIYQLTRAEVAG